MLMDEGGSHRRVYRASNKSKEPIVPTPSTMTMYDPKGTHWASYTTTQHGPTPVTAAAAAGSVKGRVAGTAIGKWQQVKSLSYVRRVL